MATNVVRYSLDDSFWWGRLEGDTVIPLREGGTTADFLAGGGASTSPVGDPVDRFSVVLASPVTPDKRILCQGKNYAAHIVEGGMRPQDKTFNMFFTKAGSSLTATGSSVRRPPGVELLDYEVELGLVIGREVVGPGAFAGTDVSDVVAALVVANDVSARDVQIPQQQWFKGKSYRGFCPVGPRLIFPEAQEWELLGSLDLELWVNGVFRQRGNTSQMIYSPAETLTEMTGMMDLQAGDLILTGTPSGVALKAPGHKRRSWLGVFLSQKAVMRRFVEEQKKLGGYLEDGDQVRCRVSHASGIIDTGYLEFSIQGSQAGSQASP